MLEHWGPIKALRFYGRKSLPMGFRHNIPLNFQRPDLFSTSDMGQRVWMTSNDALKIRLMYDCICESFIFDLVLLKFL